MNKQLILSIVVIGSVFSMQAGPVYDLVEVARNCFGNGTVDVVQGGAKAFYAPFKPGLVKAATLAGAANPQAAACFTCTFMTYASFLIAGCCIEHHCSGNHGNDDDLDGGVKKTE